MDWAATAHKKEDQPKNPKKKLKRNRVKNPRNCIFVENTRASFWRRSEKSYWYPSRRSRVRRRWVDGRRSICEKGPSVTFPIAVDLVVTSKSFLVRPLSASFFLGVLLGLLFFILKLESFYCSLRIGSLRERDGCVLFVYFSFRYFTLTNFNEFKTQL